MTSEEENEELSEVVEAEELAREAIRLRKKGRMEEGAIFHAQAANLFEKAAKNKPINSASSIQTTNYVSESLTHLANYHLQEANFLKTLCLVSLERQQQQQQQQIITQQRTPTPNNNNNKDSGNDESNLLTSFFMLGERRRALLSPISISTSAEQQQQPEQQSNTTNGIDIENEAMKIANEGSPRTKAVIKLLIAKLARVTAEHESCLRRCHDLERRLISYEQLSPTTPSSDFNLIHQPVTLSLQSNNKTQSPSQLPK